MRKSKYETHILPNLELIKGWARSGDTDEIIAKKLGIALSTFYAHKKEKAEFSEVLRENKEYVDNQVENALLKEALKGNTTAQIFWLKNRKPDKWRDKHDNNVNFSNDNDVVIEIKAKNDKDTT